MEITEKSIGDVQILALAGALDTRSHGDLEETLDEHFDNGTRLFVLDLSQVEVITSAGIRVLLKLTKLLGGRGLALCSLNKQVATVLDIAGFSSFFTIEPNREAALSGLEQIGAEPAQSPTSSKRQERTKVMDGLRNLFLGDSEESRRDPKGSASGRTTSLSRHLEKLLSLEDED